MNCNFPKYPTKSNLLLLVLGPKHGDPTTTLGPSRCLEYQAKPIFRTHKQRGHDK